MGPSTSHNSETDLEQPLTEGQKIVNELARLYPGDPLKPWWHPWKDPETSWICAKPDCNASIRRNELHDRKRHMETHAAKRQFSCDVCSRSFVQKSNLKSHQRTHDKKNARIYCHLCLPGGAQCPFSYTDPSSFTRHKQGVHEAPKSDRPSRKASTSKSAKGKAPARKTGPRAMAKRRTRVASSETKRRKGKKVARVETESEQDDEEDAYSDREMLEGGAGPSNAADSRLHNDHPYRQGSHLSPRKPHSPVQNTKQHCHQSYSSKHPPPTHEHHASHSPPHGSPVAGSPRWQKTQYAPPSPSLRSLTPPMYSTRPTWEEGNDAEYLDTFMGPMEQAAVRVCEFVLQDKFGGRGPYRSAFPLDPYFSARLTDDVDWDV